MGLREKNFLYLNKDSVIANALLCIKKGKRMIQQNAVNLIIKRKPNVGLGKSK